MALFRVYNRNTGEIHTLDTEEMKNRRKRRRITAWGKYYQDEINLGHDRSKPYDAIFVTLTYEDIEKFQAGQIRSYIKLIKERLKDKLIAYAWICENQKRGVPHYHIIMIVKRGTKIRKPDKGDWRFGLSNIQKAVKGIWYIISYCKKDLDSKLPKGARCFAIFSKGSIKKYIRLETLPSWLIDYCKDQLIKLDGEIKKINGMWSINGVLLKSPYKPIRNLVTKNIEFIIG